MQSCRWLAETPTSLSVFLAIGTIFSAILSLAYQDKNHSSMVFVIVFVLFVFSLACSLVFWLTIPAAQMQCEGLHSWVSIVFIGMFSVVCTVLNEVQLSDAGILLPAILSIVAIHIDASSELSVLLSYFGLLIVSGVISKIVIMIRIQRHRRNYMPYVNKMDTMVAVVIADPISTAALDVIDACLAQFPHVALRQRISLNMDPLATSFLVADTSNPPPGCPGTIRSGGRSLLGRARWIRSQSSFRDSSDSRAIQGRDMTPGRVIRCLDQVLAAATLAQPLLKFKVWEWAAASSGWFQRSGCSGLASRAALDADQSLAARVWWTVPKSRERAAAKCRGALGGDASLLTDACRARILFESLEDMLRAMRVVLADPDAVVEAGVNGMRTPRGAGRRHHRCVTLKLRLVMPAAAALGVDGHVCELQLMLLALSEEHAADASPVARPEGPDNAGHQLYLAYRNTLLSDGGGLWPVFRRLLSAVKWRQRLRPARRRAHSCVWSSGAWDAAGPCDSDASSGKADGSDMCRGISCAGGDGGAPCGATTNQAGGAARVPRTRSVPSERPGPTSPWDVGMAGPIESQEGSLSRTPSPDVDFAPTRSQRRASPIVLPGDADWAGHAKVGGEHGGSKEVGLLRGSGDGHASGSTVASAGSCVWPFDDRAGADSGSEDSGWLLAACARFVALPRQALTAQLSVMHDAVARASYSSCLFTSMPIAAALCKGPFRLFFAFVGTIYFYHAAAAFYAFNTVGWMSFRHYRHLANPPPPLHTHTRHLKCLNSVSITSHEY